MKKSNTSSANGSHSPQQSLKNTGQKQYTMATSQTLLPTPNSQSGGASKNPNNPRGIHGGNPLATAVSLLSQAASPVNHSVQQDEDEARRMTATSGQKCLPLLKTSDQTGSLLKTCVGLLLGTKAWYSNKCVLTWKPKITKSNRLLFQLSPSTPRTDETESGLLPTATAGDHWKGKLKSTQQNGTKHSLDLPSAVNLLPTPDHNDGKRGAAKVYDPHSYSQSGRTINTLIGSGTGKKLRLQPAMTEWMMGFPEQWTEFPIAEQSGEKIASKPTVTPSSHK